MSCPVHGRPPLKGSGSVHVLVLFLMQLALQEPQELQVDQTPSITALGLEIIQKKKFFL